MKVRQELALASGQRHLETERFSLFWDPAIPVAIIERIADRLNATYVTQSSFFGTDLRDTQIVILYGGRSYFSLVSVPDWVSGVFDGKIRVSLDPDGGRSEMPGARLALERLGEPPAELRDHSQHTLAGVLPADLTGAGVEGVDEDAHERPDAGGEVDFAVGDDRGAACGPG